MDRSPVIPSAYGKKNIDHIRHGSPLKKLEPNLLARPEETDFLIVLDEKKSS
jgi:hypothetical protein